MVRSYFTACLALTLASIIACNTDALEKCRAEIAACGGKTVSLQGALTEREVELQRESGLRALVEKRVHAYQQIAERIRRVQWSFDPGELSINVRGGRLVVQLPNRVLFASGEAEVRPEGRQAIKEVASILSTLEDRQFLIAGHTDNVPIFKKTTHFRSNWELSAMRAIAVVQILQKAGVSPKQLGALGYGEHHPVARNNTEAGRARNRRTEVVVMPKAEEIVPLADEIGGEPAAGVAPDE